jgi:hypothetical protein
VDTISRKCKVKIKLYSVIFVKIVRAIFEKSVISAKKNGNWKNSLWQCHDMSRTLESYIMTPNFWNIVCISSELKYTIFIDNFFVEFIFLIFCYENCAGVKTLIKKNKCIRLKYGVVDITNFVSNPLFSHIFLELNIDFFKFDEKKYQWKLYTVECV